MNDILVVEDDPELGPAIAEALGGACLVTNAAEGLAMAASRAWGAIVLDRMLPDGDGIEVLERLRRMEVMTPVIVLSALSESERKVEGFSAGADDYLGKPFSMEELCARITALRRRAQSTAHPEFTFIGDLEISFKWKRVVRAGRELELSEKEYAMLVLLARHAGVLVTRRMFLEYVFHYRPGVDPQTNVVEVNMSRLRKKLEAPFATPPMIETVTGRGYVLRAASATGD